MQIPDLSLSGDRHPSLPCRRLRKVSTRSARAIQTVAVDPRTDPRWHALTAGPLGSLFTSPPWIGAVCDTYGLVPQARMVDAGGDRAAGFVWVPVRDARGSRLISVPFSDRADALVRDDAAWMAVAQDAVGHDTPLTVRCFDTNPAAADRRFARVGTAAWHATPLNDDLDELRGRLAPSARRNLARGERGGLAVRADHTLDGVRQLHALHVRLRKYKYRLLAQPLEFFERIWESFSPDGAAVVLRVVRDGETVAAGLFLRWQDTLYYKFGASQAEHLDLRPNDALYWAAIRWAVERGLGSVDWGLSALDQPGLVAFKSKWATVERQIVTLRSTGASSDRRSDAAQEVLGQLTRLFTDPTVPDAVTARAGATLYRNFS